MKSNSQIYQAGLNQVKEAVISDHDSYLYLAHTDHQKKKDPKAKAKAKKLSKDFLKAQLLPILKNKSNEFIVRRISAAKKRAIKNYKQYNLASFKDITTAHYIAEVMFDRQFIYGTKNHYSREKLSAILSEQIKNNSNISLVIVALPFKTDSPMKSCTNQLDFAEVNFLFELYEIIKTIDTLYKDICSISQKTHTKAEFKVVCDGKRFHNIVNKSLDEIDIYQSSLQYWLDALALNSYIKLYDYQDIIKTLLPISNLKLKLEQKEKITKLYLNILGSYEDYGSLLAAFRYVKQNEPDPESYNQHGRFIPLFLSLWTTIKFKCIEDLAKKNNQSYSALYHEKISTIKIGLNKNNELITSDFKSNQLASELISETWQATIDYLAEIRSDRDFDIDPILQCFPNHIRWTVHSKPGQFALLTANVSNNRILPWHGCACLIQTKSGSAKFCVLPKMIVDDKGLIPIFIKDFSQCQKPAFYIDPNLNCENETDFSQLLQEKLTRARKS